MEPRFTMPPVALAPRNHGERAIHAGGERPSRPVLPPVSPVD